MQRLCRQFKDRLRQGKKMKDIINYPKYKWKNSFKEKKQNYEIRLKIPKKEIARLLKSDIEKLMIDVYVIDNKVANIERALKRTGILI